MICKLVRKISRTIKKMYFSILATSCLVLFWNLTPMQVKKTTGPLPVKQSFRWKSTPAGWQFKSFRLGCILPYSTGGGSLWDMQTPFPVDVVYTWVNGSDPKFTEQLERLKNELQMSKANSPTKIMNIGNNRFAENDALRASLRSLEKYANWVRHVFIVTNGQIPSWLNLSYPRVTVVTHEEIFDEPENLPSFSSSAILHNIHKIKGLSERFINMNDDVFFGRNVSLDDFFTERKGTKVYLAWNAYTKCGKECNITLIRNGICDDVCNYDHCAWDGGDCGAVPMETRPKDDNKAHCDYSVSILFTNALLSKVYGYKQRKVIEHAPMLMEISVKRDLDKRFPNEIKETTRRKLRSPLDVQFELSYMSFLMEAYNKTKRYEPVIRSSDVKFIMMTSVPSNTRRDLKFLKKSLSKFICINDDVNYNDPKGAEKTINLAKEFYQDVFPNPSSFEKQPLS